MLYKHPGPHFIDDDYYDYVIVDEAIEGECERHVEQGWFISHIEAKRVFNAPKVDDSPPTRDELEVKGKELGLKFDGRTSDKTLLKMINEAVA